MVNEYKEIVLIKGLEDMKDYAFRTIKSLLRKELNLTKKMQDDYDRIQLADLLEDKFPQDAGLSKLIEVCESIEELKELTDNLKREKAKVQKKNKKKGKTAVKKRKQDEPSTSESNKNKPSSKKERKQNTKTEGGKKKTLAQEQTQLPECSGTDMKNDEDCLQTPHKPPPTPPSISSSKKQKNTNIKNHSIIKTKGLQEKQQLVEFSTTSNFPASSEIQTFEGHPVIAPSRRQSSHKPLEAHVDLKTSPCSPTSPCQKSPLSPASDSSIHLNSHVPSTRFGGVQVPHVPSTTALSNVGVPLTSSKSVFHSSSALQKSPITVSSSIQDLPLPTPAAPNSTEAPQRQAIATRSVQNTRMPSATLTSKAHPIMMPPPATASNNAQVPHSLATTSRSISVAQRTSSNGQAHNSATVKASKNVQAPREYIPNIPNYFQASQASPSATPSSVTAPQVPRSIDRSRAQATQIHPGTGSIPAQAFYVPPSTMSRSGCATQLIQEAASSTGKALPLPKVEASRKVQASPMSSATTPRSLLAPHAASSTATRYSSPSRTPRRRAVPREPSREEGHHQGPKHVMVLKVTEPFIYDMREGKMMFHATVATETEFFRVKVFEITLKSKFTPRKIIAISDYFGCNGFLEIYKPSCVSDVNINQTMVVPNTLRQRANATPKISHLFSQTRGTFVNGDYVVTKKTERNNFIYYEIEDDTGKMEVVVHGRLTNIRCERGSKLRLVCFELTSTEDSWQLKSVSHSYMQVISARM